MLRLVVASAFLASCSDVVSCVKSAPASVLFSKPDSAKVGEPFDVTFDIKDESHGEQYQLCAIAPSGAEQCQDVPGRSASFALDSPGEWKLEVRCDHVRGQKQDGFRMVAHGRIRIE